MYDATVVLTDGRIVDTRCEHPTLIPFNGFIVGGNDGKLTIYGPQVVHHVIAKPATTHS